MAAAFSPRRGVWPGKADPVPILAQGKTRDAVAKVAKIGQGTIDKIWIIENQFGRRNLPAYTRGELSLVYESLIAERAKERQRQGGVKKVRPILGEPVNTAREVAKIAKVSHGTIAKVKLIAERAPEADKKVCQYWHTLS